MNYTSLFIITPLIIGITLILIELVFKFIEKDKSDANLKLIYLGTMLIIVTIILSLTYTYLKNQNSQSFVNIGSMFLLYSLYFFKFPPKYKSSIGYKYSNATKSKERWYAVQKISITIFLKLSLIILIFAVIIYFSPLNEMKLLDSVILGVLFFTGIHMILADRTVKKKFNDNYFTLSQNTWFWLLQIIGWGIPTIVNTWAKYITDSNLNKNYIISEGVLFFTLGIISSYGLRIYLKRNIDFVQLNKKAYSKIVLSYLLFSTLFSIGFIFLYPIYQTFHIDTLELNNIIIVSVIANSFLFLFFWMLFYISIKLVTRFRENKLEKLELKASLKEAELNTLKGQINPHFMFNSLNNIRGLMLEDVTKSREMLTRLSELLRFSLTKNANDKIPLTEELEMVKNYLSLSKIQLEERLQYQENIDVKSVEIEIPPMLIQLLIENAIKHGISKQPNGGIIELNITENTPNLHIEVINTGKLVISKNTTQVGIQNIKKRLFLLYGNHANFSLTEQNNSVIASIVFPLDA